MQISDTARFCFMILEKKTTEIKSNNWVYTQTSTIGTMLHFVVCFQKLHEAELNSRFIDPNKSKKI